MAINKELEERLQKLEEQNRLLRRLVPGLESERDIEDVTKRADYIEHGSDQHAIFLGLIEVQEQDKEDANRNQYILYESPNTGKTWRLEDEISPFTAFPNPEKIALITLRQKVSELEAGKPPIPDGAPPLLVPRSASI